MVVGCWLNLILGRVQREVSMSCALLARRFAAFWLLLTAPLVVGCVPRVVWLPDSSGLVFTENKGKRLVRYDLKQKKKLVLVEDTGTRTVGPDVSPDGAQVAVARWKRKLDKAGKLQVVVYSIKGKEEWRSPDFDWEDSRVAEGLGKTSVRWLAKDHLLVIAGGGDTPGRTLIDRKKGKLISLEDVFPILLDGARARPDDKGFLAFHKTPGDKMELAFVDWQGKAKPIVGDLPDAEELASSRLTWEKDTAILSGPTLVLRADTRTGKLTRKKVRPDVLPTEGWLVHVHPFPRARTVLCCVKDKEPRDGETLFLLTRAELHDLTTKKRRIILDRCDLEPISGPIGIDELVALPSPDGKLVAVGYRPDKKSFRMAIFDSSGKKVADFKMEP
jgi:hypothetical protein